MTATDRLIATALGTQYADIPPDARDAARRFLLDAAGTGLSGTRQNEAAVVLEAASHWGDGQCTVIGRPDGLAYLGAAVVNGFLIHNQEFDGVHETAIVHPMAVILPALLAEAENRAPLSGPDAVLATVIGLDIAVNIALAATSPVSFYRQGMCAALGATCGIARLRGYDHLQTRAAFGHCYSQLSGTMQAHREGSAALPLQMGFNARAALCALDLAEAGVPAPIDVLEGRFGYFALMEESWSPDEFDRLVERRWRVTELSHKPWPTGRATHAALDALLDLRTQDEMRPAAVSRVEVAVSELVGRLVDRPALTGMSANYARLCLPYVATCALLDGHVSVEHFDAAALADEQRLRYAERIRVRKDTKLPPDSLTGQTIHVDLVDGREFTMKTDVLPGHPDRPLTRDEWVGKFRRCCESARPAPGAVRTNDLLGAFESLEEVGDFRSIARLLAGSGDGL